MTGRRWMMMIMMVALIPMACGEMPEAGEESAMLTLGNVELFESPYNNVGKIEPSRDWKPVGLSCGELLDCAVECELMDLDCYQACIDLGTPDAQRLAWDLADCALANNCRDADCVLFNCESEIASCLSGQIPECDPPCAADEVCEEGVCVPVSQGLTCEEVLYCALECPEMDIGCYQACIDEGTPEAQELAWQLANCALDHGCSEVNCVMVNCAAEIEGCMQGPADVCDPACAPDEVCEAGECVPVNQGLTCEEMLYCAIDCPVMDIACYQSCLEAGSPEAQDYAWALADCALQHGCQDEYCVMDNCSIEISNCLQN